MIHPTVMADLAREHQHELHRRAAFHRLRALVDCCRPSRLGALLGALLRRRDVGGTVPAAVCCP